MQLVIQLPIDKQKDYIILIKQNGCYMSTGAKFTTKAKAIAYCRQEIYKSLTWYSDKVLMFDDSDRAYDNGTTYTKVKIGKAKTC